MRVGRFFGLGMMAVAAAPLAAAQDATLMGTYTQNQACKGDGSDPAKKLVKIRDGVVDSNFGPCTLDNKAMDGKVLKSKGTCKGAGGDFDVSLVFTVKDESTVDFLEEGSQYKSVLHRCPAGTAGPAAAAPAAPAQKK
jgi:hypothetical protein